MNLFRKKTTLPEGPARMSVSPSASKKEIGNPAASIGLVIPEAPNYDEERGQASSRVASSVRQLRDVLSKPQPVSQHDVRASAHRETTLHGIEKHLAKSRRRSPATPKRWNPCSGGGRLFARSSRREQRLSASPRKRAARHRRQARQARPPHDESRRAVILSRVGQPRSDRGSPAMPPPLWAVGHLRPRTKSRAIWHCKFIEAGACGGAGQRRPWTHSAWYASRGVRLLRR